MITYSSDKLAQENYQKFFQSRTPKGFNLKRASIARDFNIDQISHEYHEWMKTYQKQIFAMMMKSEWLDRHFRFDGHGKVLSRTHQGHNFNFALKEFYSQMIGYNHTHLITPFYKAIRGYIDDFFPNYEEINVLEYDFPFPFEYMRLEDLFLVHKMPERMELLREGERKKMSISEFEDYISAWITEAHLETGRQWTIQDGQVSHFPRYVVEIFPLEVRLKRKKINAQ